MSNINRHSTVAVSSSTARSSRIPYLLSLALNQGSSRPIRSTIYVQDESMFPTFLERSPLIIEQLQDPTQIQPGQIYYIVDHSMQGFLRRVSLDHHQDYIRLTCDNADKQRWPAHYMRLVAVWAIFRVIS